MRFLPPFASFLKSCRWPCALHTLAFFALDTLNAANALALQDHNVPNEGLYAHQLAHVYYIVSLAFFFVYIRRSDFAERGWGYLKLFCILMVIWNLVTLIGHAAGSTIADDVALVDMQDLAQHLQAPYTGLELLYYLSRLDHLFNVPALFCLYMALRIFYHEALARSQRRDGKARP